MRWKEDSDKDFADKFAREAYWEMTSEAEETWTKMKTCNTQIGKDVLGKSRGSFMVKKGNNMLQWGCQDTYQIKKKLSCIGRMQE